MSEHSLFNFFKMRVSPEAKELPSAIAELIETRGKSSTDDISVMPIPKVYQEAIKAEIVGMDMERNQNEKQR